MTRKRCPRKPRAISANTLGLALCRAACLTDAEVRDTIAPALACMHRLRQAAATEDQHAVLHTIILLAQGIEASGIVRGLHEHFASAMLALQTIRQRALASGAWSAPTLYWHELDALDTALDLHEFQLRQLSAGELHAIAQKLIARAQTTGAPVVRATPQTLGLLAA